MEKQAIWKIPVIFELFPKTLTGATVRPADIQPWVAPLPQSRSPVSPPQLHPNLACLPHQTHRTPVASPPLRVLQESIVHAQLTALQTKPPQQYMSYYRLTVTTDAKCLLSAECQVQVECSKCFTHIDLFPQQIMTLSILLTKKLRHRKIKQLARHHTARKWKCQDSYPSNLALESSSCARPCAGSAHWPPCHQIPHHKLSSTLQLEGPS